MKQHTFAAPNTAMLNGDLSPYNGAWGREQVIHLLRRTMFGAHLDDVAHFLEGSLEDALDELLQATATPDLPINDYNEQGYTDPDVPAGETWIGAPYNNEFEGGRIWSLKCWWMGNMIEQNRSISEKMLLFWFNHVPIQFYEVFHANWDYRHLELLRTHALGNFKSLMREVTTDFAMLHYLNGQYNHKDAPDENYARELQELFCIGKGPDAHYTEGDVQAAARILTGWRVDYGIDRVIFDQYAHDTSTKTFSEFYGNHSIQGGFGYAGAREVDHLIDMIFEHNECALFICRKLYRFFVHHNIDEWTEEMIIVPLAEIYRENNYEILPVLRTLFGSQHFFDVLRRGAIVKSPIDYIVSLYRDFNTHIPPKSMRQSRYEHNGALVYQSFLFDQNIGDPPNVAGWAAYYQVPSFDKSWITTNTLPYRAAFTDWVLWSGISTQATLTQLDIIETVKKIPNAANPNALVDFMVAWQYPMGVEESLRAQLKAVLLSGQLSDYYWTNAWNQHLQFPYNAMYKETVHNRLKSFFYTLLHQEEYQLA